MTADFGGIAEMADEGREGFGVKLGVNDGAGFLFWRMRRNSLSLPIFVGPRRSAVRVKKGEQERRL